jgi:hypothetical protein
MGIIICLHHWNAHNELYKMSPIFNIYPFRNILPSRDPHAIDKSHANFIYLYYEFSVQKFIKQMPPAECSACNKVNGLYSGKKRADKM